MTLSARNCRLRFAELAVSPRKVLKNVTTKKLTPSSMYLKKSAISTLRKLASMDHFDKIFWTYQMSLLMYWQLHTTFVYFDQLSGVGTPESCLKHSFGLFQPKMNQNNTKLSYSIKESTSVWVLTSFKE